jgi:hypothetical protein
MEAQAQDPCELQRRRLVGEIAALARATGAETGRAALSFAISDQRSADGAVGETSFGRRLNGDG